MKKSHKHLFIFLVSLLGVFLILALSVNTYLKNKIEKLIKEELPENMISSYDELNVDFFNGSVNITNPQLIIKNKWDQQEHTFINLDNLKISHFRYWKYLFNKEIQISKISFENPEITYYKHRVQVDSTEHEQTEIKKEIFLDEFKLTQGKLRVYDGEIDSLSLHAQNIDLHIQDVMIDQEVFDRKIPFDYKSYTVNADSLFLKAGNYENLYVDKIQLDNNQGVLNEVIFKTKYSKAELSKIIKVERDHYNLQMKALKLENINFGEKEDRFYGGSKKIVLDSPNFEIYRDKLLPDDTSTKDLYSKMLRELPFDLSIDSLQIENANLKYEERVHQENKGGFISFNDFNAKISNLGNTYSEKTDLHIKANFMDQTPFDVNWNFDVQDKADAFIFKAQVGKLSAERMNNFTEPNLKVKVEGEANKTYFTIDGNNNISKTEAKINYSDFKITVLQKDGKKKNKFISAVVNIFVSKDSDDPEDHFREGNAEVTRNKDKSIFNFFWISLQGALADAMTGSGKSE